VDRITIFVPEEDIKIIDNKQLKIKNNDITISWNGLIQRKSRKEIEVICD